MALRRLEKLTVNGADLLLMELNDTSIFSTSGQWAVRIYNNRSRPSWVTNLNADWRLGLAPTPIASGGNSIITHVDNTDGGHFTQYQYTTGGALYNGFTLMDKNDTADVGIGTSYSAWSNYAFYMALYADDENELLYAVTIHYYNYNYSAFLYTDETKCKALYNTYCLPSYIANGGGATHIAKVTGQLKDLSSNLSDILIVSGGGGGGLLVGDTDYSGKDAGGISGSGDNSADQSTGNAFGQGESGTNVSGGGSGLYGGYKGTSSKGGGAGSGYIGNSLLSNKKMVGYNVPTSSTAGTKTESVNVYSAVKEENKPKAGDGWARIKFMRGITEYAISMPVDNTIIYRYTNPSGATYTILYASSSEKSQYFYRDDLVILHCQQNGKAITKSGDVWVYSNFSNASAGWVNSENNYYIGGLRRIVGVKVKARGIRKNSNKNIQFGIRLYDVENSAVNDALFVNLTVSDDFTEYTADCDITANYLAVVTQFGELQFKDLEIIYI